MDEEQITSASSEIKLKHDICESSRQIMRQKPFNRPTLPLQQFLTIADVQTRSRAPHSYFAGWQLATSLSRALHTRGLALLAWARACPVKRQVKRQ